MKENIEKVYDLIELFDFSDLSESDKKTVLSVMKEEEYTQMRKTVGGFESVFNQDADISNAVAPNPTPIISSLRSIINYPVKLYQIAASIAVILSVYIAMEDGENGQAQNMIANYDTIMVKQIDTFNSKVHFNVEVIKDIETNEFKTLEPTIENIKNVSAPKLIANCEKELCPTEIETISSLNTHNSLSNDAELMDLLVAMN